MVTLEGLYIFLHKGNPLSWKQKVSEEKEVQGLIIALNHEDAKKWSDYHYEKHKQKISPYLVGSSDEHFGLNLAVWKAHYLSEKYDLVFVLSHEIGSPIFIQVPIEELPDFLQNVE